MISEKDQEKTKQGKKQNVLAHNMIRENKYDFHQRERILGLPEVPLEKPYDSRSSLKQMFLGLRTNINKLT